ncbi:hypothetical protein P3X46_004426 [Hevea brasiliensis]|uniref:Myb/SANT-like domain-containing protein n=1 Tax=Hevea brasiliensis TaxID=3981 RepID=A0ABQ9MWR0_HEVBR|nr:hypothetical protein P3X46_004426 [Hevea brasiliensis]
MDDELYLAIGERYGIDKLKGKYNHLRVKHHNFLNWCNHYDLLGQVFSKSTAIGHLHHASTQLPPTSDEEHQTEEEFLNRGIHGSDGEKSSIGNSKGKQFIDDYIPGCNRVKKESKFEKLDSCLEMWASSLSARAKRDLAKAQKYKSQRNEATSVMSDPYSIEACMDMLEAMKGVSDAAYSKALEKFVN